MTLIDRAWIAAHIPHQGGMCLLDRVESWTGTEIVCRTRSHLAADNPLRYQCSLGIANGIEYAAQAMAVRGAGAVNSMPLMSISLLAKRKILSPPIEA